MKKDPDNDLYKIIEFDGNGYHAYLTVIYDASRVTTTKSEYYGVTGVDEIGAQADGSLLLFFIYLGPDMAFRVLSVVILLWHGCTSS